MFTTILRASSLLSSLTAERRPGTLNWSLNPFCYAGRTMRKSFGKMVCMGVLVVANARSVSGARGRPVHFTTGIIAARKSTLTTQRAHAAS
jgi:hypothetical protein